MANKKKLMTKLYEMLPLTIFNYIYVEMLNKNIYCTRGVEVRVMRLQYLQNETNNIRLFSHLIFRNKYFKKSGRNTCG